MKYITRAVYDAMQMTAGKYQFAGIKRMRRALKEYRQELAAQLPNFPEPAVILATADLHDTKIISAKETGTAVRITLTRPPNSKQRLILNFRNWHSSLGIASAKGRWWLYHEVTLDGQVIQLDVLLDEGELSIWCNEIVFLKVTRRQPRSSHSRNERD